MAAYEESQVKAALLYNFAKFVEWPDSAFGAAGGDLVYAVVGSDPFGGALSALAGKTALGRTVSFRGTITLDEAGTCHVVYVSASEKDRIAQVVDRFKGKSVLTVGDVPGFAERGGVIGFTKDGNRIGFEVNEDAAAQAGLKISPKLLALGKVVKGRPGGR